MAFAAAASGARAIYWYGQSATSLDDPTMWNDVLEVVRDLRRLSGLFALEPLDFTPAPPLIARAARYGAVTFVVVANPGPDRVTARLPLEGTFNVVDVLSGEDLSRNSPGDGQIRLAAYDARVLALVKSGGRQASSG